MIFGGGKLTQYGEVLCLGFLLILALGAAPVIAQQVPAQTGLSPLRQSTASNFEVTVTVQDSCTISRDGSFRSEIRCMGNTPMEALYTMQDDREFAMLTADQGGGIGLARQVLFCELPDRALAGSAFSIVPAANVYTTLEACF